MMKLSSAAIVLSSLMTSSASAAIVTSQQRSIPKRLRSTSDYKSAESRREAAVFEGGRKLQTEASLSMSMSFGSLSPTSAPIEITEVTTAAPTVAFMSLLLTATAAPTVAPSADVELVTYPPTSVVAVTALETFPPVFDSTEASISLSMETEIDVTVAPTPAPYELFVTVTAQPTITSVPEEVEVEASMSMTTSTPEDEVAMSMPEDEVEMSMPEDEDMSMPEDVDMSMPADEEEESLESPAGAIGGTPTPSPTDPMLLPAPIEEKSSATIVGVTSCLVAIVAGFYML